MHHTIGVITYADNVTEARRDAEEILDGLCGENGQPFDYHTTYNTMRASTELGRKGIKQIAEYQRDEMFNHLETIRQGLNKLSNADLWWGTKRSRDFSEDVGMLKHNLWAVGGYKSSYIWLYDSDGEGIRSLNHLHCALNKWRCLYEAEGKANPHNGQSTWVTTADVHS